MQEEEGSRQAATMSVPEILLPPSELEEWEEEGGGRGSKVRLVRSHAIRDSASPPPPGRSASPHQQHSCATAEPALATDQRSVGNGRASTSTFNTTLPYPERGYCSVHGSVVDPDPQGSATFAGSGTGSVTRGFRIRVNIRKWM
jgi:hypothetical protein